MDGWMNPSVQRADFNGIVHMIHTLFIMCLMLINISQYILYISVKQTAFHVSHGLKSMFQDF